MERNKLLKYTYWACRLLQAVQAITILAVTYYLIQWHVDPAAFEGLKFRGPIAFQFSVTEAFYYTTQADNPHLTYFLDQMKPLSVYLIYLQIAGLLALIFLILQEFIKVIRSVQQVQSFRSQNVKALRKIAFYFLWMFILSSFTFVAVEQFVYFDFNLSTVPLVLMLAAYVMAEIFKEGNRLYEEEQLTI